MNSILKALPDLLKVAEAAALKAGLAVESFTREDLEISKKNAGENLASQVLTQADLLSQKLIMESLNNTFKEYDLALLSEEQADDGSRFQKEAFWCIDPLDGTLPFTEGKKGYSISIALVSKQGESLLGVIYDPREKKIYKGCKGLKSKILQEPDRIDQRKDCLTWIMDRSMKLHPSFSHWKNRLSEISGFTELKIIDYGGAAMNAIWTMEKQPALYFKAPKVTKGGGSLWDFAASSFILREAGAWVSNFQGDPLNLNPEGTSFMNQQGVFFCSNRELFDSLRIQLFG